MFQWIVVILTVVVGTLAFGLHFAFGILQFIDTSTHYENRKNKKKKK